MRILSLFVFIIALIGCSKPQPNTIAVGTISGPEEELLEVAQKVALSQHDLNVKIIEFNDYNLPNEALQNGSIDANVYQHLPYLKATMKAHGYNLVAIGKTFVYPTGLYSNKFKSLKNLPDNALIALPNDPSNESRAFMLLQNAKLITLKHAHNVNITTQDIASNPKHLRFKELDAAQLPRILADVDAAVINTTFAIPAGLSPSRDALFLENKDSPYANLVVIREDSTKRQQLGWLVDALNSDEVKARAHAIFGDAAIAAWPRHQ